MTILTITELYTLEGQTVLFFKERKGIMIRVACPGPQLPGAACLN